MPPISIDIVFFVIFLALNLIIGLWAGNKVKSLREFAIGNKDFSTGTITSTIIATQIGGGAMVYGLQNIYTTGLSFIFPLLIGGGISVFIIGQSLSFRMGEFMNRVSVAEVMGELYGKVVRVIAAICGVLGALGYVAIQFQVIGKMLTFLLGIKGTEITILAASIVILYSAFGGIRSVTITDVFQFIAFSIFIPALGLLIWNHLQDPAQVKQVLATNPAFSFKKLIGWNPEFFTTISLMAFFTIPDLGPSLFQRISISKDIKQVKDSFTYAIWVNTFIMLGLIAIAVLLLADPTDKDPANLLNYLINKYAYYGLKGFIVIGVTSMAMSTADSDLNAAVVLTINDLIGLVKPSWKDSMLIVRLFSVGLGIVALGLALRTTNLLELLLWSGSLWLPIVTIPLLLAIYGFRSTKTTVLLGMGAGLFTVIFWDKYFGYTGIINILPATLANLVVFMGSHYILRQPGGWVGIQDKAPLLAARQKRQERWAKLTHGIKSISLHPYLQKNLPTYEVIYSLFGIYVLGATYSLFFTIPPNMVTQYQTLYDITSHSVLICTAALLTYPAWPNTFKVKEIVTYIWPLSICYILFVVGAQLVIMSGFHQVQVMIFLLNLLVASLLLAWPLMLLLAIAGTGLGSIVYTFLYGSIPFTGIIISQQFNLIYSILLGSTFLLVIIMLKQAKLRTEAQNTYLTKNYKASKEELLQVLTYGEELLKEINQKESPFDETTTAYIRQIIYRVKDYMRLDVKATTLDKLLMDIKDTIAIKDYDAAPLLAVERNTSLNTLYLDPDKIVTTLLNSIELLQTRQTIQNPIRIIIEEATLGYFIGYMKGYMKKVGAFKITITTSDTIPTSQEVYLFEHHPSFTQQDKDRSERALLENYRVVDAHYGYVSFKESNTHTYVLPINVRDVRGKVMELLREPSASDPEELKHPLAVQIEKELFEQLSTTSINLKVIEQALDTIKTYHAGVKRKSGEPFFTHPIRVALIVLTYCQDQDAILAALLHDTVEDTSLSITHIRAIFGDQVAFLVGKLTNLEDNMRRVMLGDHENVDRLSNTADKRVIYVKLADRLHNMRTIQGHSSRVKQKQISSETLNFFVPMAINLGLTAIAEELKQHSLEVLGEKD